MNKEHLGKTSPPKSKEPGRVSWLLPATSAESCKAGCADCGEPHASAFAVLPSSGPGAAQRKEWVLWVVGWGLKGSSLQHCFYFTFCELT